MKIKLHNLCLDVSDIVFLPLVFQYEIQFLPKIKYNSPGNKNNLLLALMDFKFGLLKHFTRDGQHIRYAARGKHWNQLQGVFVI
jgi:hypothetical protein